MFKGTGQAGTPPCVRRSWDQGRWHLPSAFTGTVSAGAALCVRELGRRELLPAFTGTGSAGFAVRVWLIGNRSAGTPVPVHGNWVNGLCDSRSAGKENWSAGVPVRVHWNWVGGLCCLSSANALLGSLSIRSCHVSMTKPACSNFSMRSIDSNSICFHC